MAIRSKHNSGKVLNSLALLAHFWLLLTGRKAKQAHKMICPLASEFCWLQWYFWSESVMAASFPQSHAGSISTLLPPHSESGGKVTGRYRWPSPITPVICSLLYCGLFRAYAKTQIASVLWYGAVCLCGLLSSTKSTLSVSTSNGAGLREGKQWCSRKSEQGDTLFSTRGGEKEEVVS